MKLLEAVRLIQWYHFEDQTLPIGGNCLLFGDNGSGKSTVLDAIQVALVADGNDLRLNRAANERSERTLYGYMRWKQSSEDEARPGAVRYRRDSPTSYLLLEFRDEDDASASFTCGVALEATQSDQSINKCCFILPQVGVADIEAVTLDLGSKARRALPLKDFRVWLRSRQARIWNDVGTYREELRHRLGPLPVSFHRLLVKALAFKPLGPVRQFVFDYLLDPKPVDTAALQSNLDHYKRLEAEAKDAQSRVQELDEIVEMGEKIEAERRVATSHQYMELRAQYEQSSVREMEIEAEIAEADRNREQSDREANRLGSVVQEHERELQRLTAQLQGYDSFRRIEEIDRGLEDTERQLGDARVRELELNQILDQQGAALRTLATGIQPFGAGISLATLARLEGAVSSPRDLTDSDVVSLEQTFTLSVKQLYSLQAESERQAEEIGRDSSELNRELKELEAGRPVYPGGAAALLDLLSHNLQGIRTPKPLCELIEITERKWCNAVEGYLHTRRFDIIVAPEDYRRALMLYERHKSGYFWQGREIFISGVGLVDIEKLLRVGARPQKGSLAEKVTTEDTYARAYADYLLGDVICVENEQQLRDHKAAITDTVMVYRNHAARQTARDVYARHYVGEAARQKRLQEIVDLLSELHSRYQGAKNNLETLEKSRGLLDDARANARRLPVVCRYAREVPTLAITIEKLCQERKRLERGDIRELEERRKAVREAKETCQSDERKAQKETIRIDEKIIGLQKDLKDETHRTRERMTALIEFQDSLAPGLAQSFEQRYQTERKERDPERIYNVFEQQRRNIETRISNYRDDFVRLKTLYAERRKMATAELSGFEFEAFRIEVNLWRDSRLPDYLQKIEEAKQQALQQLAEDVVFRLRENLIDVRRQIEDLNGALKEVEFGSDRYQFRWEPERDRKHVYELVMRAGDAGADSLFGSAALESTDLKETLADFLARLIQSESTQVKSELEEMVDYREYFQYDLRVHHADGTVSSFDKITSDGSGGETQTPYYIAIFASMFRMYRSRSRNGRLACGLVLLDEAFHKMDGTRIEAALSFGRRLGLQLIIATPPEKCELVAPAVERSILIYKDPVSQRASIEDFTKDFAENDAFSGSTAAQAVVPNS